MGQSALFEVLPTIFAATLTFRPAVRAYCVHHRSATVLRFVRPVQSALRWMSWSESKEGGNRPASKLNRMDFSLNHLGQVHVE